MKIELDLTIKHHTLDAMLVSDGYIEVWLPLSQCRDDAGRPIEYEDLIAETSKTFMVEEFIAKNRGLI